jgi:hypothetical protein
LVDDEDPVADAVSPMVTILEMYPDTAATTSMIVVMMQPKRARWRGGVCFKRFYEMCRSSKVENPIVESIISESTSDREVNCSNRE